MKSSLRHAYFSIPTVLSHPFIPTKGAKLEEVEKPLTPVPSPLALSLAT